MEGSVVCFLWLFLVASDPPTDHPSFAFEKLHGLDRDRILEAIAPILKAHHVAGFEIEWKTDSHGWVLALSLDPEQPRGTEAVSLEICSEVARDLSAALDVADCIGPAYRLEVGSPGVERALYRIEDFRRFCGRLAKLKLETPIEGQVTLRGRISKVGEADSIVLETDQGDLLVPFANIRKSSLVFEFGQGGGPSRPDQRQRRRQPRSVKKPSAKRSQAAPGGKA